MRCGVVMLLLLAACSPALEAPYVEPVAPLEPVAPAEPETIAPAPAEPEVQEEVTEPEESKTIEPEIEAKKTTEPDALVPKYGTSFTVKAENYAFYVNYQKNPDLVVKLGSTISIRLDGNGGVHDFVIDEFGATKTVRTGQTKRVTIVADKAGTFDYYCSVGSHRAQGMEGKFIVTE